ncbi:NnrS family protein [Sandaracinobacter sp. RS1-74]|uniref:NnrS family protein n=1 Tax=Sandaracinobacteroides sayramensis TaxID=2913411 RepID=UPI001EDC1276|nr:NnrS family protein [Sandaracinobacteroides sayramensis]MCG2839850.1 NnrS family protein [Sandaracinobacteroides sayramensis]
MRARSASRDAGEKRRAFRGPALFSFGFRPFFLFGALFGALAVPLWMGAFVHGYRLGIGGDALGWHAHEMIFGYTGAIVAGFLLTAIPNWTGRAPVMGAPLAGLFALWLAGRIAMWWPAAGLPGRLVEAGFLFVLLAAALREVLTGRNWRNLPIVLMLALFAAANLLWHAEAIGLAVPAGLGQRLALSTIALLMALIGGRIIPSFTGNWMQKEGLAPLPTPFNGFDKAVLAATALALAAWCAAPFAALAGWLLIVAGLLHAVRMARWRGWRTGRESLVLVLHAAYLWLAAGLALIGLSILAPALFAGAGALHALTAGGIGLLTVAVMTRASRGHTGRPLHADKLTAAIYALVSLGALARILLPFAPISHALGASVAGLLWSAGMLLFAIGYGPMLLRPRPETAAPGR